MIIRDIGLKDKKIYLEMTDKFYNSGATLEPVPKTNFENTFKACLEKSPYVRCLIFENENQVCGYGLITFFWSNETGGKVILIDELFVDENFRNLKMGTQFLDWLNETYINVSAIRLEVCNNNVDAIKLYKNKGFDFLDYGQMRKVIKK